MANYPITRKRGGRSPAEWIDEFAVPEPNSGCWLWTRRINPVSGYGQVTLVADGGAIKTYSHRIAYELFVGPIPPGFSIDHLCRNRACCNPDHLEPVTQRENNRRAPGNPFMRNAEKTHCKRGHEFTPENTYRAPGHPNMRVCIACARESSRQYKRSDPQREKDRTRNRKRRQNLSPEQISIDDPRHGRVSTYKYFRCRCDKCRAAKSAENAYYRGATR